MFLHQVLDSLEKANVKYALVGGYALALHGIIRATIDIDVVVRLSKKQLKAAEEAFKSIGLKSRLPIDAEQVFDFKEDYIQNRNLMAWSFVDYANPSRIVDVLIIEDIKDSKVEKVSVAGRKIPLVSLLDLKRMKTGTGRKKDEWDLEMIEEKLNAKKT